MRHRWKYSPTRRRACYACTLCVLSIWLADVVMVPVILISLLGEFLTIHSLKHEVVVKSRQIGTVH